MLHCFFVKNEWNNFKQIDKYLQYTRIQTLRDPWPLRCRYSELFTLFLDYYTNTDNIIMPFCLFSIYFLYVLLFMYLVHYINLFYNELLS